MCRNDALLLSPRGRWFGLAGSRTAEDHVRVFLHDHVGRPTNNRRLLCTFWMTRQRVYPLQTYRSRKDAGGRHNMPPPSASWPLTFWPWKWCPNDVWRGVGYLCANFSLHKPPCSRLRPDVCDRQTDRQTDVRQTSDRQTSESIIS